MKMLNPCARCGKPFMMHRKGTLECPTGFCHPEVGYTRYRLESTYAVRNADGTITEKAPQVTNPEVPCAVCGKPYTVHRPPQLECPVNYHHPGKSSFRLAETT